jgi:hypothetical protein
MPFRALFVLTQTPALLMDRSGSGGSIMTVNLKKSGKCIETYLLRQ